MNKLANITIDEKDYQALLLNDAFLDIKIISVKIIPDDSEIKDDEIYKQLLKEYKKVRDKLETYRFEKTINK
jgi:hypothetical protein